MEPRIFNKLTRWSTVVQGEYDNLINITYSRHDTAGHQTQQSLTNNLPI